MSRSEKNLLLSRARLSDLDQLMEIERLSFAHPWPPESFLDEFSREVARIRVLHTKTKRRIAAFIVYWVVADEMHILNIASHPDYRRQGLAQKLLDHVFRVGKKNHSSVLSLEVRRSNRPAIALYEKNGFHSVYVRPRYYENNEDALVMEYLFNE